jgi:D-tyrosyl-tRNA(Tyr) deacylase
LGAHPLIVRAVVQRVSEARVTVRGDVVGRIGAGLCVFIGISRHDGEKHAEALAEKLKNLRVFEDSAGKMNHSVCERGGEVLVVSQFTLYGDCRRGNRPSFSDAAPPDRAEPVYRHFVERLQAGGLRVSTGRFQARMQVTLVNDGPVTLIVENP